MRYKPQTIIAVQLLAQCLLPAVGAQPASKYCAFRVSVEHPSGEPATGVPVEVRSDGKSHLSSVTDRKGIAQLCDAPSDLVDIVVGGNRCGAVAVRYLRAFWQRTRDVKVVYENCAGEEWAVPGGCRLTIRVKDVRGGPLANAALTGSEANGASSNISDDFGRIFRFLTYGSTLHGRVSKTGYTSVEISEACKAGQSFDIERTIVLEPPRGRP